MKFILNHLFKTRFDEFDVRSTQIRSICLLTFTALFLAMSVAISLIELPYIYIPPGVQFSFRLFDTLFIFIALRFIGLQYTLLMAALEPWIHVMIDGDHSPISMFGFMINNISVTLIFYFVYYYVLRVHAKSHIQKNRTYFQSYFLNCSFKLLCFVFISILCAASESFSYILVILIVTAGVSYSGPGDSHLIGTFTWDQYLLIAVIFMSIFCIKYLIQMFLFWSLESRWAILAKTHGVF